MAAPARATTAARQYFGVGYGADMNGFGSQGGPRGAGVPNPGQLPVPSFDGKVTLDQQVSGERVFDINTDGVAHYGLYPDWIEDLRMLAGDADHPRHGPRRRGLPADVGARRRDRGGALRPLAPALPDRARARAAGSQLGDRPKRVLSAPASR